MTATSLSSMFSLALLHSDVTEEEDSSHTNASFFRIVFPVELFPTPVFPTSTILSSPVFFCGLHTVNRQIHNYSCI
ncbi:hypothetical protein AOLI_G00016600 [Acnodon oligacanthus]